MSAERRGALAGPESAAEHVRNALQLLRAVQPQQPTGDGVRDDTEALQSALNLSAAFDRLEKALVTLEQPPRGAADATGTP